MNIRSAAIKVQKEGEEITRRKFIKERKSSPMRLIGTNTDECFLIVGSYQIKLITPRWEPYLEDINVR